MKFKKWVGATIASIVLASSFTLTPIAQAEETKIIADESIYDLLVDRYFNATAENDYNTNAQDPAQFAGGDFRGVAEKLSTISQMGFSIVSIGSVFATEKYDGSMVTSYSELEPHFGTEAELKQLAETLRSNDMSLMVDFPLTNVSENHEWAQDPAKAEWIAGTADGKVRWDLSSEEVQQALTDAVVQVVTAYDLGGIRLTNLDIANTEFLNEMIAAIKEVDEDIYVISNQESDASFDANFYEETHESFRNIYKNVDIDSTSQLNHVESYLNGEEAPTQLMIDNLNTDRFLLDVEAYPPTRLRLSVAATLLLPGVPVMQYGTEIAMNGKVGPESHQLYNFKTDAELVEFIEDVQYLRNSSATLRSGEFKLLKNENGFLAFERISEDESWLVVINNSGKTTRVDVPAEDIGYDKEIRGMFESEIIRVDDNGNYPVVLDREMVEIYQIIDERGLNVGYLVALGLVYVIFVAFIWMIIKRGRRQSATDNK